MDDKEKEEEAKKETTEEDKTEKAVSGDDNSKDGEASKTISELDRADQIAERQKRENDRREELLTREENLAARKAVGGVTEAGQEAPKPEPETDEQYVEKMKQGEVNPFKDDGVR